MAREKRTVDTKAVNSATEVLTQIAELATAHLDDAKLARVVGDPTNDGLCSVQIYGDDPSTIVQVMNATPYIPAKGDDCYVYCVDNNLSPATAFIIQIRGKNGNSLQKLFANQINEALANWTAPTSSTSSTSGPSIVDTWRPIQVNGASWKSKDTGSSALNFKAGTNISLSYSGNDLTINATGGGATYSAMLPLELSNQNVFSLNYGAGLDNDGGNLVLQLDNDSGLALSSNGLKIVNPLPAIPTAQGDADKVLLISDTGGNHALWAKLGALAYKNAVAASDIALANGKLLMGNSSGVAAATSTIPLTALALPTQVGQADEGKVPTIVGVASSEWEVQWAQMTTTITPKLGTTSYYIKAENGNEINFYSTALSLPNGRIQFDGPQAPLVGDRKHVADFIFGQVLSPAGATSGAYYTSANVHGNVGYFENLFLTEYGSMGSTWIDVQDILYNRTLPAVTASDKGKVLTVTSGGAWAPRTQIPTGAGYTFETTANTGGSIEGRILGTADATGIYGWHTFYIDTTDGIYRVDGNDVLDASFSNASIIVVTDIFCISYDGGTYRLYDGTLVDTYAKFTAAVNKLGYLEEDTYIQWSD